MCVSQMWHSFWWCNTNSNDALSSNYEHMDDLLISLSVCLNHWCVTKASARSRTHRFVLSLRQSKGDRDDTIIRMSHPFQLGMKTSAICIWRPQVNLFWLAKLNKKKKRKSICVLLSYVGPAVGHPDPGGQCVSINIYLSSLTSFDWSDLDLIWIEERKQKTDGGHVPSCQLPKFPQCVKDAKRG